MNEFSEDAFREIEQIRQAWIEFEVAGGKMRGGTAGNRSRR